MTFRGVQLALGGEPNRLGRLDTGLDVGEDFGEAVRRDGWTLVRHGGGERHRWRVVRWWREEDRGYAFHRFWSEVTGVRDGQLALLHGTVVEVASEWWR